MNRLKKRCPCCDGRAALLGRRHNGFTFFSVKCISCGLHTEEYSTYIEAIDKWNQRNYRKTIGKIINRIIDTKKYALDSVHFPRFIKKDLQELTDMCFDEAIRIIQEEAEIEELIRKKQEETE